MINWRALLQNSLSPLFEIVSGGLILILILTNNSQSSSWSIAWMGGGALRCVCGRHQPGQLRLERCCGWLLVCSTTYGTEASSSLLRFVFISNRSLVQWRKNLSFATYHYAINTQEMGESMLAQEWTRWSGQRAGLRPSWLSDGQRGWPSAYVIQRIHLKGNYVTF